MLASVNLSDRLSVDVQGAQSLRAKAAAGDPEALRAAAKQFEVMFVQIMLKTMRETRFTTEGDTFGDSNNLKLYRELLDQQWAQKMVDSKGLGFADAIVKRLDVEAAGKAWQEKFAAEAAEAAAAMPIEPAGAVESTPKGMSLHQADSAGVAMNPNQAASAGVAMDPNRAASVGVAMDSNRVDKAPVSSPAAAVANPAAVASPAASATDRKSRFIETMLPYAQEAEVATGVPARFILAQAALESGWGKREILAEDGTPSHNLFGIKATGWSGKTTEVPTTEYRQGLAMKVTQNFRAYADYGEAFSDYGNLLRRRYGDAVAAGNDAEAFASALANGGYATDPSYAAKLRGVIKGIAEVVA